MNYKQEQFYAYQIDLFNKIYSYMKINLETELNIESQEPQFRINWIKTWLSLKEKYEESIKKQTEKIKIE